MLLFTTLCCRRSWQSHAVVTNNLLFTIWCCSSQCLIAVATELRSHVSHYNNWLLLSLYWQSHVSYHNTLTVSCLTLQHLVTVVTVLTVSCLTSQQLITVVTVLTVSCLTTQHLITVVTVLTVSCLTLHWQFHVSQHLITVVTVLTVAFFSSQNLITAVSVQSYVSHHNTWLLLSLYSLMFHITTLDYCCQCTVRCFTSRHLITVVTVLTVWCFTSQNLVIVVIAQTVSCFTLYWLFHVSHRNTWLLLSVYSLMFHITSLGYCCHCTGSPCFTSHHLVTVVTVLAVLVSHHITWLLLSLYWQSLFHISSLGYCYQCTDSPCFTSHHLDCCQCYLVGYCTRQRRGVCEECCVQKHSDCIRSHVRERDSRLMAEERMAECQESLGVLQVVCSIPISRVNSHGN